MHFKTLSPCQQPSCLCLYPVHNPAEKSNHLLAFELGTFTSKSFIEKLEVTKKQKVGIEEEEVIITE